MVGGTLWRRYHYATFKGEKFKRQVSGTSIVIIPSKTVEGIFPESRVRVVHRRIREDELIDDRHTFV